MPEMTLQEGVSLSHALVDAVSKELSVRTMFIKGPRHQQLGLRPPRQSVDVDVLVDPAAFQPMVEALGDVGWRQRVADTRAHVLPFHSAALAHDRWPCEIDLHHHFPGFFEPASLVFDRLWSRRATMTVAGRDVPVCDVQGAVLIAALHAERNPAQRAAELPFLIDVVRERMTMEELTDLAELAAATGCVDTLRSFLDAVGAPPIGVGTTSSEDMTAWRILCGESDVYTVAWLHTLRRTPLRRLPRVIAHGLLLTEAEIRSLFPQAPPGWAGLMRARWWRLKRAGRDLPKAYSLLRSAKAEAGRRPRKGLEDY